ncbi:hypothetical protein ASG11_12380 [Sphingomonas sp. Leaf357]|uniref:acyl-CoA thioesterase n=1 Tax=Sphingomonas sp. Leaf357 TaxID=1736350 RepID=UPI0006F68FB5|nr:thioesterase family protein [Sphingomonas sp. Leaf357]KQS04948.1 hypothetical protein ASG11_12380 [Sphingomonas sp. Leaf357]
MSRPFPARRRLRFAHCDAAGIAYYPSLFELADGVIEDWTEIVLGVPRSILHLELHRALPTVELVTSFVSVSRLGDWLDFTLRVDRLGTSSIDFVLEMRCGNEHRLTTRYTQVLIDMTTMRPLPWPNDWRARIEETMR